LSLSDEILMAYVDGELDEEKRASVAQAVATDSEVARRVAQQRLLRASVQAAFSAVLDEPVPEHLVRAARSAPAGTTVADLARKRAANARLRRLLPQWGAIAASLMVGALIGARFLGNSGEGVLVTQSGQLIAHGALAHALTDQLAGSQAASAGVQIGVSFRAHSGEYCRTFSLRRDPGAPRLSQVLPAIRAATGTSMSWHAAHPMTPVPITKPAPPCRARSLRRSMRQLQGNRSMPTASARHASVAGGHSGNLARAIGRAGP
jgi:hypothetical protein